MFALLLACQSSQEKHIKKGKQYLSNRDYEDAAAEFMMARKKDPSNAELNYLLGLCYSNLGDFEQCDKYFSKAYILSPKMRPLILSHYYELGESRKQKGDTDSAIKAFAKVLELDPSYDLGKNFFYLGDYYFERGKFNECINAYQKATLEFPDSPKAKQAHFRMAKSYLESGNYKAALDEAQNFLGLYEKLDITTQTEIKWIKGQAAYNLAERALEEKNYETAVSYARMVINTGVPKVLIDDSYFILGDSYLGLEQISDAKDAYNHVLRLNPNGSGRLVEKTEQRLQKIFMGDYTIDEDVMLEENDL